jgi:Arc/MetJ family transcription regulator
MATHLALDAKLVAAVVRAGGHSDERAAVIAALEEYVRRHQRVDVLDRLGAVDFDFNDDHPRTPPRA